MQKLKLLIKPYHIVILLILLCGVIGGSCFVLSKHNKEKTERETVLYKEAIDTYFQYLSDGSVLDTDSMNSIVYDDSVLGLEPYYFEYEDKYYETLVSTICSRVSFEYNGEIGERTPLLVTTLDYTSVTDSILADKEKIQKEIAALKKGMPSDIDDMTKWGKEYLLEKLRLGETKENTWSIVCKIKDNVCYIDSNSDYILESVLFSTEEYKLMFDTLSSLIQDTEIGECVNLFSDYYYSYSEKEELGVRKVYGDGTKEKPANVGDKVKTIINNTQSTPIEITILNVYTGSDAVAFANEKDVRNRGLTEDITNSLVICEYLVTNYSDKRVEFVDDFSLADDLANIYITTGIVYGLKSETILEPYSSAKLETYCLNQEYQSKYLIWGSSFKRKYQNVWFKLW